MSDDNHDLGPWEFVGRRGGDAVTLIGGSVIAAVPEAKRAAEEARRELQFDFLDDRAVLDLLRRRHADEEDMFSAGFRHGVPLALVGFGAAIYWGGVVQYWETAAPRNVYLTVVVALVVTQVFFFARSAMSQWGDQVQQNLRARAGKYREIAHIARREGADIPPHYPHYGPYPFAARFRPEVDDREQSESEGADDHGHR